MPRIKAATLEEHNERVWNDVTVALRQLLAEQGYEATTLGHIAQRAGIARNTLYNYAKDKTSLVLEVNRRIALPLLARVEEISDSNQSATEKIHNVLTELMQAFTDNVTRLMVELAGPFLPKEASLESTDPMTALAGNIEKIINEGVATGEFRKLSDVTLTGALLSGVVRSGAERMVIDGLSPEEITPAVQDVILAALKK